MLSFASMFLPLSFKTSFAILVSALLTIAPFCANADPCDQPLKTVCRNDIGANYDRIQNELSIEVFRRPSKSRLVDLNENFSHLQNLMNQNSSDAKPLLKKLSGETRALIKSMIQMQSAILKRFQINDVNVIKHEIQSMTGLKTQSIEDRLQSITGYNAAETEFNLLNARMNIIASCDIDGLFPQIQYHFEENAIFFCPGFLLKQLNESSGSKYSHIESMNFLVQHEKGHSLYHDENLKIQEYLSCVDDRFIKDPSQGFVTPNEFVVQIERGIPNLNQAMATRKDLSVFDQKHMQDRSDGSRIQAEHFSTYSVTPLELVKQELFADEIATQQLAKRLLTLPSEDRLQAVSETLGFFCASPNEQFMRDHLWGKSFEPTHPPAHYRIENAFRHPEIREALGCSPLQEREHCTLNLSR